jgi:hypothetical protein
VRRSGDEGTVILIIDGVRPALGAESNGTILAGAYDGVSAPALRGRVDVASRRGVSKARRAADAWR